MKAIEMYRNNENFQYAVKNHYSVNVPTWSEMIDDMKDYYDKIINERNTSNEQNKSKETNGGYED